MTELLWLAKRLRGSLLWRAGVGAFVFLWLSLAALLWKDSHVQYVAILDCGSASTKLTIFRFFCSSSDSGSCQFRQGDWTHMARRLSLASGSGSAVYGALSEFRSFLRARVAVGAVHGRVVGTQSFRDPAITSAQKGRLQLAQLYLEISASGGRTATLTGEEEAFFTLKSVEALALAASRHTARGRRVVAVDLGGGSLEVAFGLGTAPAADGKKFGKHSREFEGRRVWLQSYAGAGLDRQILLTRKEKKMAKKLGKTRGKTGGDRLYLTSGFWFVARALGITQTSDVVLSVWEKAVNNACKEQQQQVGTSEDACRRGKYVVEEILGKILAVQQDDKMEIVDPRLTWNLGLALTILRATAAAAAG